MKCHTAALCDLKTVVDQDQNSIQLNKQSSNFFKSKQKRITEINKIQQKTIPNAKHCLFENIQV